MADVRHFATCCHPAQVGMLLASMRRHCRPFRLYVLAWDYEPPPDADDAIFTRRSYFLANHPELAPERLPGRPRNGNEQACTVRWAFALDVMAATGEPVTVIDGDIWFMSSPEPVFAEIGAAGCAVSPHRFPPAARGLPGVTAESHTKFSRYNGGYSFWADRSPLERQAELAREWCYIGWRTMPDGRVLFGDQGYHELIQEEFGAHVIQVPTNIGPWGIHAQPLARGMYSDDVYWGGERLISYHFSSLRVRDGVLLQIADTSYEITEDQRRILYDPYLKEIAGCS